MPWTTPTLEDVRKQNRDYITAHLHSVPLVPNSVARVIGDANGGLAYLNLLYLDWLSKQFLPDTAETEWLDRQAAIWLPANGRKSATFASGSGTVTGIFGIVVPEASQLTGPSGVLYATTEQITVGNAPTPVAIRAIDPGVAGNLEQDSMLNFVAALAGVDGQVTVVTMDGGFDAESDDDLRQRVLERIRQPPMGGSQSDYEQWAKQVPGCTRAWCYPLEMGIGTVTVRVLFDKYPGDPDPWPTEQNLAAVTAYIDLRRPVAVKDFWVLAPIKQFVDVKIAALDPDTPETRAAVEVSIQDMLYNLAAPGQTIYAAWKAQAVMDTANVRSFELVDWADDVMASPGHMAILGDIVYVT